MEVQAFPKIVSFSEKGAKSRFILFYGPGLSFQDR
ncbi:uncharacterized protein G2W53_026831 [Senna tora]|uniref:Uncharacterized protein n=1 Tax=Senna tora TaxID=362788 RepID=A0A834WJ51_9FABA|nr:uncharacterized protein G2W53_026831 [Senna tora]